MKVLLVEPNADPRIIEIDGSLAAMQSLVGGLIETVYPFSDLVALICNDEGKLAGLPQNRPLKHPETGEIYDIVCGPFFLCSAPADSENFESLPDDLIEKYREILPYRSSFALIAVRNSFEANSTRSTVSFSARTVWKPKPFSALTAVSTSGGMTMPEMNPRRSVRTAMTVTTQTVTTAAISSASARPIMPVRAMATNIRSATTATRASLPASQFGIITTSLSRCSAEMVIASSA